MKFTAALVSSLLVAALLPVGNASAIAGGTPVPPGKYGWLAKIGNTVDGYCSGTLVSARHILTAAHCFAKNVHQPEGVYAHFPVAYPSGHEVKVRVVRTERHPWGVLDARGSDMAVIELEDDVAIEPIDLIFPGETGPIAPGRRLTVAGYGHTESNDPAASGRPRELALTATKTCVLPGRQWFCADAPGAQAGIRPGDSGGPVFTTVFDGWEKRRILVGVASNRRGVNTWFTNLSLPEFSGWLHQVIYSSKRG